ncbi:TerD family protein [Streptomyces thinghirensis]|nr:TerD family protein [Streptomyces thinghirensis]
MFFNNKQTPDTTIVHTGDNRTGEGAGDDEAINVNLAGPPGRHREDRLPGVDLRRREPSRRTSARCATPTSASSTRLGGAEIARYDLSEDAATETAMVFGELYRNGAEWKFRAVGQGYASGLVGIAQDFGVNV